MMSLGRLRDSRNFSPYSSSIIVRRDNNIHKKTCRKDFTSVQWKTRKETDRCGGRARGSPTVQCKENTSRSRENPSYFAGKLRYNFFADLNKPAFEHSVLYMNLKFTSLTALTIFVLFIFWHQQKICLC